MTRLRNFAVDLVSRAPARVQTKLLVAFLAMVALLILLRSRITRAQRGEAMPESKAEQGLKVLKTQLGRCRVPRSHATAPCPRTSWPAA